jgi:hypothetical protein
MPVMAPERIRLNFDVTDRVRRALNARASFLNLSLGEVIEQLAEACLQEELAIADRKIAEGVPGPQPKRGRKPKPP